MKELDYLDWKSWRDSDFGVYSAYETRYYEMELGSYLGRGKRFLEIGFGNGNLLCWARDRGAAVTGVEIEPELLERARKHTIEAHSRLEEVPERAYDIIVAFDVLEHIPADQAVAFLDCVRSRMAPGGMFIARFPNGDSPLSMRLQNGDMTHGNCMGVGKVRQLSQMSHLHIKELRAPRFPVWYGNPVRSVARGIKWRIRQTLVQCLAWVCVGSFGYPFDANYIVVMTENEDGQATGA